MKGILLIILLLSLKSYSQDFIGKWKVFSYEDEIAYYNKTKDFIIYKNPTRKDEAESFKQMSEIIIFSVTYTFESNGKFINDFPAIGETVIGSFEVDKSNKKIVMIDNEGKKDELKYSYNEGILFLEMNMETGYIKLGLVKVSK
ncbi:hypothetical protein A5893_14785 [Pedobacter psychrophilus]|uniref:Lipocalin-like domain-containing protein n=1 Tax=Pedobacter psychrophilus TaxID=1826909 RepID=A0A179DC18_9SPHI|nr:hypothetical protein [Pedobacter psychrophilus]OAQ38069.1 hypothetical protein A5893_14785 [Pedobacter psychrophilus]